MDSDGSGGPSIPSGVLKTRSGWAGDELELEHRRHQLRRAETPEEKQPETFAAVDLRQFQNTEVGKGYQARHVVRQRSRRAEQVSVRDMTQPKAKSRKCEKEEGSKRSAKKSREELPSEETLRKAQLEHYLGCEGLRTFRLEIERILQSKR